MSRACVKQFSSLKHGIWDGVWLFNGWLQIPRTIENKLRERDIAASVRIADFDRPLEEQLAETQILLPSLCPVDADLLSAAPQAQLIMQPAAGYNNISLTAAKTKKIRLGSASIEPW